MNKKIVFLSGTRADFGKLKSLMKITQNSSKYDVHIFVTGMHMNKKYGYTVNEIEKSGFKNIFKYINHDTEKHMDRTLAKTIDGFSNYINLIKPDLIVVHGDRVEAMAGAIVGSLNNILVAHIEGGELSGTIDELIRHSVSKMSHIHLVSNNQAKKRLLQLGEIKSSIFIIGSPDLDLMSSETLPSLTAAKNYYNINFPKYNLAMFHPITTEYNEIKNYADYFVDALIESKEQYILIYPNNDLGSNEIIRSYKRLEKNPNFKLFPSIRFEYFLTFLKFSKFIIGNSSAGIREAPYYNIPTIDIGTRQKNRSKNISIFNCNYSKEDILMTIKKTNEYKLKKTNNNPHHYGNGKSNILFFELLETNNFWKIKCQKQFNDLNVIKI